VAVFPFPPARKLRQAFAPVPQVPENCKVTLSLGIESSRPCSVGSNTFGGVLTVRANVWCLPLPPPGCAVWSASRKWCTPFGRIAALVTAFPGEGFFS